MLKDSPARVYFIPLLRLFHPFRRVYASCRVLGYLLLPLRYSIFPVIVFDEGAELVSIRIHDELHGQHSLLSRLNELNLFRGINGVDVSALLATDDGNVAVLCCALVELLHYLVKGFELLEVFRDVHFMLAHVGKVLVCLPQCFDGFFTLLVVEVDIL